MNNTKSLFVSSLAAYSEVPWQHTSPSVSGHVPRHSGERGHVPDRNEEHVQPQTSGPQKIRSKGRTGSAGLNGHKQ